MGLQLIPKETAHARIQTLMTQRSTIEASIASQSTILTTNGVTMETPLVDREGFPRADIDVYNVRLARVRIIELRNDLRGVMDEIGQLLEVVYKPGGDGSSSSDAAAGKSTSGAPEKEELKPFAKVDGVAPSSPAAEAGLLRNDLIIKFGNLVNVVSIQAVGEVVAANENNRLEVKVRRDGGDVILSLTPRKGWGGRGMLGCHIVPVS